jgi:rhomboid family GlyGly-CTERM serine protease
MSETREIATIADNNRESTLRLPRSIPWLTFLLAGLSILIMAIPGTSLKLQYEHTAIDVGQYWRLFSCHLTHWSANHLFWDVLMFIALGALAELHDRKSFIAAITISACMIPLLLAGLMPGLDTYRGLSGIDSALTGLIATSILCERRKETGWTFEKITAVTALGGLTLKMLYEAWAGAAIFVASTTESPVPAAHLAGAFCGILAAATALIRNAARTRPQRSIQSEPEKGVQICY